MKPKAHSIENTDVNSPNIAKDSYLSELMKQCIVEYKNNNKKKSDEILNKVINELFDRYHFSNVGDSNSIWGRQYRLICSENVNDKISQKNLIEDVAEDLGFVVQSVNSAYSDPSDSYIFVPDRSRYLQYDHNMNIPEVDIIISRSSDFTEIKSEKLILDKLARIYDFDVDRRPLSVLKENKTDNFVEHMTDIAKKNNISYVISKGLNKLGIDEEWHPNEDKYVALYLDSSRKMKYKAHMIDFSDRNTYDCGSKRTDEIKIMTKSRAKNIFSESEYHKINWCGHPGCNFEDK